MDWFEERADETVALARDRYPILNKHNLRFTRNNRENMGFLEFWPADETGTPERPRPKDIPVGEIGVELLSEKTRPIDVLGDVVSHHLVNVDPTLNAYYKKFEESLTDEQKNRLKSQYRWAIEKEGETRPFEQWYQRSGLPGYFRGYAFEQWERPEEFYTKSQMKMFDEMMGYLSRK